MPKPLLQIANLFQTLSVPLSSAVAVNVETALIPLASIGQAVQRLRVRSVGCFVAPVNVSDDNHLSVVGGGVSLDYFDNQGNYLGSFTLIESPNPAQVLRLSGIGLYLSAKDPQVEISAGVFSQPGGTGGNPPGVVGQVGFGMSWSISNADSTAARVAEFTLSVLYEITLEGG